MFMPQANRRERGSYRTGIVVGELKAGAAFLRRS
jgi:hypothetical protein